MTFEETGKHFGHNQCEIFFWDFKTFNKRSRVLVVNQFLQTNMNVSVAKFKYKNYGIQNYQHSFLVLLYNIAKSKKANLQGMAACLGDFYSRRRSRDSHVSWNVLKWTIATRSLNYNTKETARGLRTVIIKMFA